MSDQPADPVLPEEVHLCPSATKLTEAMRGHVVICGSHGGRYPAALVAEAGLKGVVLCDAGVGLDRAGIASLELLGGAGTPAAVTSAESCRIGDARDMARRGRISFANDIAAGLGVLPGQDALVAARLMIRAGLSAASAAWNVSENRSVIATAGQRRIVLIDSASLVEPEDAGQIVVTGSHGGLVGGVPAMALQVDGFAAFFNDAGVGIDSAGISRLPALEARGIAAMTVAAASARIGEARSTLEDGIVSHFNPTAARLGAKAGMRASDLAELMAGL